MTQRNSKIGRERPVESPPHYPSNLGRRYHRQPFVAGDRKLTVVCWRSSVVRAQVKRIGAILLGTATVVLLVNCGRSTQSNEAVQPAGAHDDGQGNDAVATGKGPEHRQEASEEKTLREELKRIDERVSSNPKDAQAYYDRGCLRQKLRRHVNARKRLELSARVLRDFETAHQVAGGDWLVDPVTTEPVSPERAAKLPTDKNGFVIGFEGIRRDSAGNLLRKAPEGREIRVGGPGFPQALVAAGKTLLRRYQVEEAAEYFRRAAVIDPDGIRLRAELARMHGYETGDWETAVRRLEALAATPGGEESIDVWFPLAMCYRNAGLLEQAERAYRRVLELSPDSLGARANLGLVLLDLGKHEAGLELLNGAAQADPNDVYAGINLSKALNVQGRPAEALAILEDVLEVAPTIPAAWNNYGNALNQLGRYEESIRAYRRMLFLLPDYADAYYNMGRTYHDWGRYDDAIDAYRRALEIVPDSTKVLYNLGNTYSIAERFQEAEETYRHAIRITPKDDRCWNNLGNVLVSLERYEEAREAYHTALEINPHHRYAISSLAHLEAETGRLKEAQAAYDRALQLHPESSSLHRYRGLTSMQLRQRKRAIEDLTRSIEIDPGDQYARLFLWLLYRRAGNRDQAKRVLSSPEVSTDANRWPATLLRYYAGEISRDDLLTAATDDQKKCEAYYYIGERILLDEDHDPAKAWFAKCVETGVTRFTEHRLARWRLKDD